VQHRPHHRHGTPLRVGACHYFECRKHHGAVFYASAISHSAAVRVTGQTADYQGRVFCPICGASVYSCSGDEVEVHLGALDTPTQFIPTYDLWTVRQEGRLPPFAVENTLTRTRIDTRFDTRSKP
jgi:hypothetical protein